MRELGGRGSLPHLSVTHYSRALSREAPRGQSGAAPSRWLPRMGTYNPTEGVSEPRMSGAKRSDFGERTTGAAKGAAAVERSEAERFSGDRSGDPAKLTRTPARTFFTWDHCRTPRNIQNEEQSWTIKIKNVVKNNYKLLILNIS